MPVIALVALVAGCAGGPSLRKEVRKELQKLGERYAAGDARALTALLSPSFRIVDSLAGEGRLDRAEGGVVHRTGSHALDRAGFRAHLERTFAELGRIEDAKYILEEVREHRHGVEAEATFRVWATGRDGVRRHRVSRQMIWFERVAGQLRATSLSTRRWEGSEGKEAHFRDSSRRAGLDLRHTPYVRTERTRIIPGNFCGSGASAGDFDGDGHLDLVVGDGKRARLLRNRGDGTFEDVTGRAGLGVVDRVQGAYFLDIDNDRRLDILFTRAYAPNQLFRNLDGRRFEDVSARLGDRAPYANNTSAAIGDLTGNGFVDIFVARYGKFHETGWPFPLWQATNGQPDILYVNNGDGTFTPRSFPIKGWGFACTLIDHDGDGRLDIYVVNDFGDNRLYRNDGNLKFTEVAARAGVTDQGFGMGVAVGDHDGDGRLDLYVSNMFSTSRWVFADPGFPLPWFPSLFLRDWVNREFRKITRGNSLLKARGDGTYENVAERTGSERADWSWGCQWLDYDHDGDLDLYVVNGYISGQDKTDQ